MPFSSVTFLFFFLPFCAIFYFSISNTRLKNLFLLGMSLAFYAWGEPKFVLVMICAILLNYAFALVIGATTGRARTSALALAIILNLAGLAIFKYMDFLSSTASTAASMFGVAISILTTPLPLGISFFTFHCMSYLIDVYRNRSPPNRRLAEVALYIAFFPQLIAGPIVRYRIIAGQLRKRRHTLGRASAGMRMFVIGLSQKLLIADQVAPLSQAMFDHISHPRLMDAWIGMLAYTIQIYFDFAGYSNMAIGLALMFGFSFPRNFDLPYRSRSITEFWRRWHITLSSWFRDYLYIPLGGNRHGQLKTYRNLIVVFLACGLWHGANWTFVLWGAWHGCFLVLERAGLRRLLASASAPLAWAYAMIAVSFGWVLFRAQSLGVATQIWEGLLGMNGMGGPAPVLAAALQPAAVGSMVIGVALAIAPIGRRRLHHANTAEVEITPGLHALKSAAPHPTNSGLVWLDLSGVAVLLALCVLQVSASAYSPFLYFRF